VDGGEPVTGRPGHWWSNNVVSESELKEKSEAGIIVLVLRWQRGTALGLDGLPLKAQLIVATAPRWADRKRWADHARAVPWEVFRERLKAANCEVYASLNPSKYPASMHVGWSRSAKALPIKLGRKAR
jgi:hypothetical protein